LKRIIDDTERRLNILFDGLNNETVSREAVDKMGQIAQGERCASTMRRKKVLIEDVAMANKDTNVALAMHVELLTTATGEMTAWAVGLYGQHGSESAMS
jgi:protein transport protein SEC31